MSIETTHPPALTMLTEEETMFRDAVHEFAEGEIRPHVQEMEEAKCQDAKLIASLFEMGLMGVDIPEAYGGAGGSFFQSILAVEQVSRVDASVQNTLFNNAILIRWGTRSRRRSSCQRAAKDTVGAYALSEAGSGSDAFALSLSRRDRQGRPLDPGRPEAVDHQRRRGRPVPRLRHHRPVQGLQGHHGVPRRARRPGLHRGQAREQAGHPRLEHLRAAARPVRDPRRTACSAR